MRLPLTLLSLPLLLLPLSAGCPSTTSNDGGVVGCTTAYLGDPAQPMELELFYLGEDLLPHDLASCGPVDIVEPPQGGRVLFVGVKARNLDPCNVNMSGALRDPRDGSILGLESRSTNLEPIAGRAGWGQTAAGGDPTNGFRYVANIPVCPNMSAPGSPRDVQQQLGVLDLILADRSGKRGEIKLPTFPRCAQPDSVKRASCECLCQAGYTPLKCQNVTTFPDSPDAGACALPGDGGVDGGGPDGT